jgi:hypothetical protein
VSADSLGEQYNSMLDHINWDDKFQLSTNNENDITNMDQQMNKQNLKGLQNEKQMRIIMKSDTLEQQP